MAETDALMRPVQELVKTIESALTASGWRVASNWGELVDPSGRIWFGAGYAYGEYTLTISYRPRGAGRAEGTTRVRVTPALAESHPDIAGELAADLVRTGNAVQDWVSIDGPDSADEYFLEGPGHHTWPPERWAKYAGYTE